MKRNPSANQLTSSLDRRVKHLMINTLEKFEDRFPDINDSRSGQVFKGDLRNMFNDVMRAQRDELSDYDIDYRPLKITDDNVLAMTQTFMETIQKVEFEDKPSIRFYASFDRRRVIEALRTEFDAGVIINDSTGLVLEIIGVEDMVRSVLPVMDRYRLHANVNPCYGKWREGIVKLYRS